MNEELVDVAVGRIVQPDNRLFHGNPMPTNVYRIQLVRVLDGYDELLPPYRPPGADDEDVMNLRDCLSWNMLWPKCQIRLGAGDSTPRTTPPVVPAPSHGKTSPTPSADPGHHPMDMDVAQIEATPTHYWAASMIISTNMVGATWTNFSSLLLKNPTLVQKTLTAHLVARR